MITRQGWKNIEAEFGEIAFERVQHVERGDLGLRVHYSHNNNDVDNFLCCREYELRPLPELYAHDDSFYINAFEMWQWRYTDGSNDWTSCNKPLSFNTDKEYRRKNSAALPFDLERAKAGDAIECLYFRTQTWLDCKLTDKFGVVRGGVPVSCDGELFVAQPQNVRMKYPARKP